MILSDWVDCCALSLGALLPALDPTDATRHAAELATGAYEYDPDAAAAIYALELWPLTLGNISDYQSAPTSSWILAFELPDATDIQKSCGLAAAQAILDAVGVSPFDAVCAQWKLESLDEADFPDNMQLTADEQRHLQALWDAGKAANRALAALSVDDHSFGRVVAHWPSKVRFEAARLRWLARTAV